MWLDSEIEGLWFESRETAQLVPHLRAGCNSLPFNFLLPRHIFLLLAKLRPNSPSRIWIWEWCYQNWPFEFCSILNNLEVAWIMPSIICCDGESTPSIFFVRFDVSTSSLIRAIWCIYLVINSTAYWSEPCELQFHSLDDVEMTTLHERSTERRTVNNEALWNELSREGTFSPLFSAGFYQFFCHGIFKNIKKQHG